MYVPSQVSHGRNGRRAIYDFHEHSREGAVCGMNGLGEARGKAVVRIGEEYDFLSRRRRLI